MRRWHEERDLMLRRWRMEIAKHEYPDYSYYGLAPVPASRAGEDLCHCYRGPGFMRKQTPYGCPRPRCGICHEWDPGRRAREEREALRYEREASGGW